VIHKREEDQDAHFLINLFLVANTLRMIVSATRLLLICVVKYYKLLIQNSC